MTPSPRHIILACALLAVSVIASAQTDPLLTHYDRMPAFYNPGALGTTEMLSVRGGARLQWLGIDNAPVSFVATGDMPVKVGKRRIGVGLALQQESLGLYRNIEAGAMVAYHMPLAGGILMPGLRLGMANEVFKGSETFIPGGDDYHQPNDEAIPNQDVSGTAFDPGLGVYYTRRAWYAGVSLLHMTSPVVKMQTSAGNTAGADQETGMLKNYEYRFGRTLYFNAGGNIQLKNSLIELTPSLIVATDFNFLQAVVTAGARYNKFISAGLAYRYKDAVALRIGVDIKNFYMGYSYEYPTSAIIRAGSGSHELIAGYSLKLDFSDKNKNKHKSIRIM